MARILLGVTGGIAAYKACELLRLLMRAGHEVIPLVTRGADRFVRREGSCLAVYRADDADNRGNTEIDGDRVVRFDKREATLPYVDAGFSIMR